VRRVDFPKGEPENPISNEELIRKFLQLTTYAKRSKSDTKKIIDIIWNLEEKIEELFSLI
jgi:2-methylcitrate dehydratase PrpD